MTNSNTLTTLVYLYQGLTEEEREDLYPREINEIMLDLSLDINEGKYLDFFSTVNEIKKDFLAYIKIGTRLNQIKTHKIFRQHGIKNWGEFCPQILQRSYHECNRYIVAARVGLELIGYGFTKLPKFTSHCLELSKLNSEDLKTVWENILEKYDYVRLTTNQIKMAIAVFRGEDEETVINKSRIKIEGKLGEKVAKLAKDNNLTQTVLIEQLIDKLIESDNKVVKVSSEAVEAWELDLQELMEDKEQPNAQLTNLSFINTAFTIIDNLSNMFNQLMAFTTIE
jgi:hypothetical protein